MQTSTLTLDTADDTPVHVHRWLPDDGVDVRGVVQVVHGMAEHGARYAPLAEDLTAAGFAVYADDHRGHGRTAQTTDDLGFLAASRGWALVLDDLHRLTQLARGEQPGVPVVLLGHSMGSFLAKQYVGTFPDAVDALVLSGSDGPAGALAEVGAVVARVERRRLGPRGRSQVLDQMTFGSYNKAFEPTRTDFDWLSRDPAQVDAYIADPWCGFVATTQMFMDLLGGLRAIELPAVRDRVRRDLPVHVFSGALDPVGGEDGVRRLVAAYEEMGLRDVQHRVYPDGRHEMLNEVNRDEVVADLLAWLDRVVAARG